MRISGRAATARARPASISVAPPTPSYLLVAADLGSTLRVRVTASNASGPGTPVTSAQSAVVVAAAAVPVNSVLPAISGTAQVGQSLSSSTGTWSGSPTSYAYQWSRCNSAGASCVDFGWGDEPVRICWLPRIWGRH